MISMTVDTKRLEKVLKEYMQYSSRTNAEACNQHAYYIARSATHTTKAAEAAEIRRDLEKSSKSYPGVPLAAILVNRERAKHGKKGLYGEKMRTAMESFIKRMVSHRNFLRAGWIPAIKKLATVVPRKGGSPIPPSTDKKGRKFGGATPAKKFSTNPYTTIWNSAANKGNKLSEKSKRYIEEGLKKAVNMEIKSMIGYIRKKQQEAKKKFWS